MGGKNRRFKWGQEAPIFCALPHRGKTPKGFLIFVKISKGAGQGKTEI